MNKFQNKFEVMGLLQNYENVVTPADTLKGTSAGVQKPLNLVDVAYASEDTRACALQGIRGSDRKKQFQYFCKRPLCKNKKIEVD